jgi:hypothetical protein
MLIIHPGSSVIEGGQLPKYLDLTAKRREQVSMSHRVEIITAVTAVRENYCRARLIVWQIAWQEKSILALASRGHFRLRDDLLELDKALFRSIEELDDPTMAEVKVHDLRDNSLEQIKDVVANESWLIADCELQFLSQYINLADGGIANAKIALLESGKLLRERIIVPLKQSMALRELADYLVILRELVSQHREMMKICTNLRRIFDDLRSMHGSTQIGISRVIDWI